MEREAALQSALEKEGASGGDVSKSTKKSKRKPKNGAIDAMAAATGISTPAQSEPPVEGDMQYPEPDAVSEMSKKDKRRAKEAAKKAQKEAGSSSVNLVSYDIQFHL